ncbi:MAG: hypothetical protein K2X99_12215 [Gemmatimonadaceae bacterium]|nr:hypothetical protein [Gemmatimonadaceae bacterium]
MRLLVLALLVTAACATVRPRPTSVPAPSDGSLAQIYYWRAKPGKLDEYSRYIREQAEPIDHEAQRRGAFLSVATFISRDTLSPWTHMRVFILRDSAQWRGLSGALDSAGLRLHPDSAVRAQRAAYSATLRDRVGSALLEINR